MKLHESIDRCIVSAIRGGARSTRSIAKHFALLSGTHNPIGSRGTARQVVVDRAVARAMFDVSWTQGAGKRVVERMFKRVEALGFDGNEYEATSRLHYAIYLFRRGYPRLATNNLAKVEEIIEKRMKRVSTRWYVLTAVRRLRKEIERGGSGTAIK